jgi:hypothetical protein
MKHGNKIGPVKQSISQLNAQVASLMLSAAGDYTVMGVYWDTTSNPVLVRTDASATWTAAAGVDGARVTNNFDNASIYREIGPVTDSYGNVFIRIPKFYIQRITGVGFKTTRISKTQYPGFYLPQCFWDFTNNKELAYIDVGKYKASLSSDTTKLESKPNVYPLINDTIIQFRTLAVANGTGYQQMDIHVVDMLQALFTIEFATLNSQAIVAGYTNGQYTATHLALATEAAANRIIVTNAQGALYRVGQTISVGTSRGGNQIFYGRTITAITVDTPTTGQTAIVFDGAAVTITIGNMVYNTGYKNGFSANIAASTGSPVSNSDGLRPFVYRGIESLFGDIYQWVDGVNINVNQAWVCKDARSYASNLFTAPYQQLAYINGNADGYLSAMGYDPALPFAQFPVGITGSSTTYYSDYYYQDVEQCVACFGGSWYYGSSAGLWYWSLYSSSSNSLVLVGGRLLKKPL